MKTIHRKIINNCLRRYRKERGLSQKEVAEILDVNNAMVSRWEKGICFPEYPNIIRLSALYRRPSEAMFIDLVRVMTPEIHRRGEEVIKRRNR